MIIPGALHMQELKEAIKRGDIEKPGVINRHVFPLSMGHV